MITIHGCSDGENCKCESQHPEHKRCPFCGGRGFHLDELKVHLLNSCKSFDDLPEPGHKEKVNSAMEIFDSAISTLFENGRG